MPIGHRHTLDVLVGGEARLSLIEEDLIRLNSHPLVEPGMTMREVKELIVLNDELLDPPAPARATYQMVRRAADALLEAGSARFRVRGAWQKHGCGNPKFGWANYEIAEFDPDGSTRWVRFQYRDEHYRSIKTCTGGKRKGHGSGPAARSSVQRLGTMAIPTRSLRSKQF